MSPALLPSIRDWQVAFLKAFLYYCIPLAHPEAEGEMVSLACFLESVAHAGDHTSLLYTDPAPILPLALHQDMGISAFMPLLTTCDAQL